jgi:hypothetical protein
VTTTTKYLGMLFAPEMALVLRRQVGPKTQTRRGIKPQPVSEVESEDGDCDFVNGTLMRMRDIAAGLDWYDFPPPHPVGSVVYAKENFTVEDQDGDGEQYGIAYAADGPTGDVSWVTPPEKDRGKYGGAASLSRYVHVANPKRLRSALHMPRWAARTWLRITEVRVERIEQITEDDAISEGFTSRDEFWMYTFSKSEGFTLTEWLKSWTWAYTFAHVERPEVVQ